jgi:hypothetical protein
MKERTVILYTFSKSFSMVLPIRFFIILLFCIIIIIFFVLNFSANKYLQTGWRLGGAIGPKEVITQISKLNSNQEACTNHFVQFAGYVALTSPLSVVHINSVRGTLMRRRDMVCLNPPLYVLLLSPHLFCTMFQYTERQVLIFNCSWCKS